MEKMKMMLVDDEERFLSTTSKLLSRKGYEVATATSGSDALEKLRTQKIHVVILDVKMPGGIDGIETLREIKRHQPLTEVILLTGHGSVETSIEGMKMGAFDYLLKPIKLEELMVKLSEAFEKKDLQEQKIRKARIKELVRFPGRVFQQEKE